MQKRQVTGETVPESGIYRVTHAQHRLPKEVILVAFEKFPRCAACDDLVSFELVRMPGTFSWAASSPIRLYELPVIAEEEAEAAAGD